MEPILKTPQIVAYCNAAFPFIKNKILQREIAINYPGALALVELAKLLQHRGISMVTGDVAIQLVKDGKCNPIEIFVIKDDASLEADELIRLGAKAKILCCAESPLFAANFYKHLKKFSQNFDHCIVFRGAAKEIHPKTKAHTLYFPSFDKAPTNSEFPWHTRKLMVMVAGNKYWRIRRSSIRLFVSKLRDIVYRKPARISKEFSVHQLHDKRLEAILYFGNKNKLDLYGSGWENLNNLPSHWKINLLSIVSSLSPKPCGDKLATIGNYKYSICYENIVFPGYVTEKIIDCIVAGVVPVYLGAPDIKEFISEKCYVDARKFNSMQELEYYLENITFSEWSEMVSSGKDFLNGDSGQKYSYLQNARLMEELLLK